jgi:hypothetical protein
MPDYGKLIDEEKQKKDSAIAAADARRIREIELVALFREVEIELGMEMAKANAELKKRAAPLIFGPFRPIPNQEKIELAFGLRNPCCRLTLQNTDPLLELAAIRVELIEESGKETARMKFVLEGNRRPLKAYRSLVEGFPDRSTELTPAQIAQEIVCGMIRGRFE